MTGTPRTTTATIPQREPVPALVALSNATLPRRPAGARAATAVDPFASHAAALALVEPLGLSRELGSDELNDLRALAAEAGAIAEALIGRRPPSVRTLNRLAARTGVTETLRVEPDGTLTVVVHWYAETAVAELAHRLVEELGRLDPARLRHCAREACDLLFYDTTRSRTQRWHSESPCGNRERQDRFTARSPASNRPADLQMRSGDRP